MRRIKLYVTAIADENFVSEAQLPPFQSAPDVVIWGNRVFKRESDDAYIECFFYAIPIMP